MTAPLPRPLSGLKVLDIAELFPAPLLAAMLGDLGADVVKVEPPAGDGLRRVGIGADGVARSWALAARNKRSIVLDPASDDDLATLAALTAVADVVVCNQTHDQLVRRDCTPEAIHARNPRAVVVSLTAFGTTGPLADMPGNGSIAEAFAGVAHLTGSADGPPTLPSYALGDTLGAISALNGVLAALYWRDANGGVGQHVDATLYEPLMSLLAASFATWAPGAASPQRHGSRIPGGTPRNVYRCNDGSWVVVSGPTDPQVARMLHLMDHDTDAERERFGRAADRVGEVADDLDALVASWIAERSRTTVLEALAAARIPAAPVHSLDDLTDHPHVIARSDLGAIDADGAVVTPTPTPQLSHSPARWSRPSPELGADSAAVLHDWLHPHD